MPCRSVANSGLKAIRKRPQTWARMIGMRLRRLLTVFVLAATPLLLTLWSVDAANPTRTVTFFFTGYVRGGYGPCGCPVSPSGGLARRAGFVQQYTKKQGGKVLQLDLGNYFMPLGPGADTVNQLMMESLDRLPLQVMNLAHEDLFLWTKLSKSSFRATKIISTNLTPLNASLPAPERYIVVEIPARELGVRKNVRIGFLGLSDPKYLKPNSGFTAVDPQAAVAAVKSEIAARSDFLVVLGDLPGKVTAIRLAKAHPEIYAILLVERAFIRHAPEQVNNAVLLWSIERGRHLGQLELELDEAGNVTVFKPSEVPMDSSVAEDETFLKRQKEVEKVAPARVGH